MTATTAQCAADAIECGASITILYVNAEGQTSERRVDVTRVYLSPRGTRYFEGYCHLREESRTFRADRVLAVTAICEPGDRMHPTEPVRVPSPRTPARSADSHTERCSSTERRTHASVSTTPPAHVPANPSRGQGAAHSGAGALGKLVTVIAIVAVFVWIRDTQTLSRTGPVGRSRPVSPPASSDIAQQELLENHTARFMNITGISDGRVLSLYGRADTDRSGELSWSEIEAFQRDLMRTTRYEPNDRALRPTGSGTPIRYIPIDYETVGGFSSAVARRYTVRALWTPEEIYGWQI